MSEHPSKVYERWLRERGVTAEALSNRLIVSIFCFGLPPPFTLDELQRSLEEHLPPEERPSPSEVFRTLQDLEELALIERQLDAARGEHFTYSWTGPTIPQEILEELNRKLFAAVLKVEAAQPPSPLCEATHRTLVAGVCPWCGREIWSGDKTVRD